MRAKASSWTARSWHSGLGTLVRCYSDQSDNAWFICAASNCCTVQPRDGSVFGHEETVK
jgi:hypothetical protein